MLLERIRGPRRALVKTMASLQVVALLGMADLHGCRSYIPVGQHSPSVAPWPDRRIGFREPGIAILFDKERDPPLPEVVPYHRAESTGERRSALGTRWNASLPNAERGFRLLFSATPFPVIDGVEPHLLPLELARVCQLVQVVGISAPDSSFLTVLHPSLRIAVNPCFPADAQPAGIAWELRTLKRSKH